MEYNLPWFLTDPAAKFIYCSDKPYLVLDFETTNQYNGSALEESNDIVLACWTIVNPATQTEKSYHKFGGEYDQGELLDAISYIQKSRGFIVAHHAKFELQWLKRLGVELRDVLVYCTMLGQWVLDGNRNLPRNLDALAATYKLPRKIDLVSRLIKAGVDPKDIPKSWLLDYCARDVELAKQLFEIQVQQLKDRDQLHLALARNLCCAVLADIEMVGMNLDTEAVNREYEETLLAYNQTSAELYTLTGGINLASPKQLAKLLYEDLKFPIPKDFKGNEIRTKTGLPSTNAALLDRLKPETDEQRKFLELYRKYNKLDSLLTKNLDFFKGVVDEYNSKFYGIFNQGITGTHRLSSSGRKLRFKSSNKDLGVQLQNLPRVYKKLFWSGNEDYVVGEADGAQLEFRVAADLGKDPVAYDMIATGGDVHADTAKVFVDWNASHKSNQHPDFVGLDYKKARQPAKAQSFKPLYGGQGSHPAEREYCEFFRKKYEGISRTQDTWAKIVLDRKVLRTPYGMEFYWPDTKLVKGYITNTTQIYNYPVQGLATAEIIPIALVFFWHMIRDKNIVVFTTIHDSIVSYVHKDEIEDYKRLSKEALTTCVYKFLKSVYNYDFVVPLGVGIKISRNWGQSDKEEIWNVFPDGREDYKEK